MAKKQATERSDGSAPRSGAELPKDIIKDYLDRARAESDKQGNKFYIDFVKDIQSRFKQYGETTKVSPKQKAIMEKILVGETCPLMLWENKPVAGGEGQSNYTGAPEPEAETPE